MHYSEIEMAKSMSTQRRFLQEIQFTDYVVVLMRVAICFEYLAWPPYLKICCGNVIKFLRTIRGQQCYLGVALHS